MIEALSGLTAATHVDPEAIIRLGRTRPDDAGEPFGISQFALRASRAANGVSRRHGEVARGMWNDLWPDRATDDVPIGHVTNGVHVPTWLGAPMRELLDRHLGDGWMDHQADPATWAGVDDIPDEELWAVRSRQRAEFVEWVRAKSVLDRLGRDEPRGYVEAAATAFDPDALTIGFARRLATYKRLHLLVEDARAGAEAALQRPPGAARARRQGASARRGRQAAWSSTCSRSSGRRSSAAASSTSTTTTSRARRAWCAAATCG